MPDSLLTETTYSWADMETRDQLMVLDIHAEILKMDDRSTLARIFNLGNPKIVMDNERKYFRIDESSIAVMKLLIKNYL